MKLSTPKHLNTLLAKLLFCCLFAAGFGIPEPAQADLKRRPAENLVEHALLARIPQEGLDYLAELLEFGLESNNLQSDIVQALEGQTFEVLVPQLGGYAVITVDYGDGRPFSDLDGFRYDDVSVVLSSTPQAPRVAPEAAVIYPSLYLNEYQEVELPELHVFASYDPFISASNPVSAVVEAVLVTSGVLRPYVRGGEIAISVSNFETNVFDMRIKAWGAFPTALSEQEDTIQDVLGQAILDGARKEVNDALSDVFMSGLNDILFDRDQDGAADTILDVADAVDQINQSLDSDFDVNIESRFQSNPVTPAEALLRFDLGVETSIQGDCFGRDSALDYRYTLLEQDHNEGHDPPLISTTLPDGTPYQFALSLSDDLINALLGAAYRTGRMCLTLGADTEGLPDELRNLLNTTSFSAFPQAQWLFDAAPDADIRFTIVSTAEPYIEIAPNEADHTFRAILPEFVLNVYANIHEQWLRVVGYRSEMTAYVDWKAINLGSSPFLDIDLEVDSKTTPIFGPLIPEDADQDDVAELFPTLFEIASGEIDSAVGGVDFDLTACIDGIEIEDFELVAQGEEQQIAHYLQAFINLRGVTDLGKLLSECLLGEDFLAPEFKEIDRQLYSRGDSPIFPAALKELKALRIRGGPWQTSHAIDSHALLGGQNAIDLAYADGSFERVAVFFDATPPVLTAHNETFVIKEPLHSHAVEWRQFDPQNVEVHRGLGTGSVAWHPDAIRVVARGVTGLETEVDRPQESFGCSISATRERAVQFPVGFLMLFFAVIASAARFRVDDRE
jgi:hypothetical protein